MKKRQRKPMNQVMCAFIMLLFSAIPIACSHSYIPAEQAAFVPTETDTAETSVIQTEAIPETVSETPASDIPEAASWQPDPRQLNLAYCFPEGADSGDPAASYAAKALNVLMEQEKNWINGIYQNIQSADTFRNIQIAAKDGDGNPITSFSNVKEIMSMANVYLYDQDTADYQQFLNYAETLWKASHSYTAQISERYYCGGCLEEPETSEAAEPAEEREEEETLTAVESAAEEATPSDATPADAQTLPVLPVSGQLQENRCPGHVDLIIHMNVIGLNGINNLFRIDPPGKTLWNDEMISAVHDLNAQDWTEQYGLVTSAITAGEPLSSAEIRDYMAELPSDLSETRREVVRYALESVGRVPYYWGGKASRAGYEGNRFGALADADPEGRVLKGLDCSGWVSWVYWSATGNRLDYASTSGLAAAGIPVERSELKPGDLIVRTGENAHVIMFLGWTADGRIQCIHESSETACNVTISILDANWPYYRRLTD